MPVKQIPDGYHAVTPYLLVPDVRKLLHFLEKVFHSVEAERAASPDGRIMHARVRIGDSNIMMGEVCDPWQPAPCSTYVYVPDVDAAYARALELGAISVLPPMDQFYGDRSCGVKDALGNTWWIATHVEDVSPEEKKRRMASHGKPA